MFKGNVDCSGSAQVAAILFFLLTSFPGNGVKETIPKGKQPTQAPQLSDLTWELPLALTLISLGTVRSVNICLPFCLVNCLFVCLISMGTVYICICLISLGTVYIAHLSTILSSQLSLCLISVGTVCICICLISLGTVRIAHLSTILSSQLFLFLPVCTYVSVLFH